jgi:hypothetical protein
MDPDWLVNFLNGYLEKQRSCRFYDPMLTEMNRFRETSKLLQACGHKTEELDEAIADTMQSVQRLNLAQENAISKWKQQGVYFVIDRQKAIDIETANLQ